MAYPSVPEFGNFNLYRRSEQRRLVEQLDAVREIVNSVRSIRGGGSVQVSHSPSGVTISSLGGAADTGTAAVIVDWRITTALQIQVDERILTGVSRSTAANWITKATGGTCDTV